MIMFHDYYHLSGMSAAADFRPLLALLSGLDAINPQTEHYMNFGTARPLLNKRILYIAAALSSRDVQVLCYKEDGL